MSYREKNVARCIKNARDFGDIIKKCIKAKELLDSKKKNQKK
jgi:hypothetical protein